MDSTNTDELIEQILVAPDASYWLKHALVDASRRDPLDALKDAELLARILRSRFHSIAGVSHADG